MASSTALIPVTGTTYLQLGRGGRPSRPLVLSQVAALLYVPCILLLIGAHLLIRLLVYMFHTAFLSHLPLLHLPTLSLNDKPPILIHAMQACGALFVDTPEANDFVSATLNGTRDQLLQLMVNFLFIVRASADGRYAD